MPGYLSGKGFQSGEEGTLINTAILKARGQAAGESTFRLHSDFTEHTHTHTHYAMFSSKGCNA